MASVLIKGVYMGSSIKESEFDGKKKTTVLIDVYQPESESAEKMVQIRSSDVPITNTLNKDFSMGSVIEAQCTVNAYRNIAYYNLQKLIG